MEYVAKSEAKNLMIGGLVLSVLGLFLPIVEVSIIEKQYNIFDMASEGGIINLGNNQDYTGANFAESTSPRNFLIISIILSGLAIYLLNSEQVLEKIRYAFFAGIGGGGFSIFAFLEIKSVVDETNSIFNTVFQYNNIGLTDVYSLALGAYTILIAGVLSLIGGILGLKDIFDVEKMKNQPHPQYGQYQQPYQQQPQYGQPQYQQPYQQQPQYQQPYQQQPQYQQPQPYQPEPQNSEPTQSEPQNPSSEAEEPAKDTT